MEQAVDLIELPLFPLNTVLFPGQVLPLHIFEERYRLMVRRCLAEDKPFGIALIQRGQEVGGFSEPHMIGTVARIMESTHLPDGTMNIVTVGTERFRIRRLIFDQPYLRGAVETLSLEDPEDPGLAARLAERVRSQVGQYVKLIAEAAGLQINIGEMPTGLEQVGYLAAVAMQIDNQEKQTLLGSTSLHQILTCEITLLARENALLTWMARTKSWPESVETGPSGTLLPN